jgi:light-regulated signal transduction histidine kinase (bacteriophytochrome)
LSLSDGLQADLEQFAHSASHDLREPIRSISVYSELFTKHYERFLDQEGKEFLSLIHSGAQRMETLLADLLSYAHASSISDEAPEPIRFQTVAGTDKSKIRATMN